MDDKTIFFDSQRNQVACKTYLESQTVDDGYVQMSIACGLESTTTVVFEREGVCLRLTARGELTCFDGAGGLLASTCVPAEEEGRGCYQAVCCKVAEDCLWVRFPVYVWYDNYPHCDGESDRWDGRIIGYKEPVCFCLTTGAFLNKS